MTICNVSNCENGSMPSPLCEKCKNWSHNHPSGECTNIRQKYCCDDFEFVDKPTKEQRAAYDEKNERLAALHKLDRPNPDWKS